MTICYFGNFDPEYSRNRVIISGLKQAGLIVDEIRIMLGGAREYWSALKLLRKNDCGFVIVGYSDSRWLVPLAKLFSGKKIIWDAFYSVYDSYVFDRRIVDKYSPKAFYYWFVDWLNCILADSILLDTNAHIDYFIKTFHASRDKFIRVLVGSDPEIFKPNPAGGQDGFLVHFHGKFIPLQGVEYIVRAAHILRKEGVRFQIIGKGQEYENVRKIAVDIGADNINWIDHVEYSNLPNLISRADVVLGIFGATAKASRVIPNKIYEGIAMAKPVITCDTPAVRELFIDGENIILCGAADPKDLAQKILTLRSNKDSGDRIGKNGYNVFMLQATPRVIAAKLLNDLHE